MVSSKMLELGQNRSVIRELFEYGRKRAEIIGAENVFDFSLGNPSVEAPPCVNDTIIELIKNENSVLLHGYTSAQGDYNVRKTVSDYINNRFKTNLCANNIYMTVGASASLSISLKALTATDKDEFIVFTPFFPEYKVFIEAAGAKVVVVESNEEDFQIDISKLLDAITQNTKAVIINSPNNPSGVVLSEQTICSICKVLKDKSEEYNHTIYLISDEPYRELVYDNIYVPYLMNYYDNTLVCYSFSKAMSLPGERIGYIAVSDKMKDEKDVYAAICGAGRALGYVCAPSLFQQVISRCIDAVSDVSIYKKNRDILYDGLTKIGYKCVKPDGAFYLFVKALEDDANAFSMKAREYELLLVPGDDFGTKGYVRIAYCIKTEQIVNSLPVFEKLFNYYKI